MLKKNPYKSIKKSPKVKTNKTYTLFPLRKLIIKKAKKRVDRKN